MKFIVDAQLPKRLSLLLNNLGANSIHTLDLPEKNRTGDDVVVQISENENLIVITKDRDFLQSHLLKKQPSKLLMVNTGNIGNAALLHLFETNFDLLIQLFQTKDYIELTKEEIIVRD